MQQYLGRVTENRKLWSDVQLLTLDAPGLVMHPGQFALARDPSTFDPYLRRTLRLYRIEGERVTFTLQAYDPLAARARINDTIDLLGPLGRPVEFTTNVRHVLLIGEGAYVASLIAIADNTIAQQREVVLVCRGTDVFPSHLLAPEIEYRTDTRALSVELITWADAIVASGPEELYRVLADAIRAARYQLEAGLARVLIDLPMPCGTGDCYACTVGTRRGVQLTCADGPAFDLIDLENRSLR